MAGIQTDEEAGQYVRHHFKLAGRADPLFDEPAVAMLRQLGQGLPRKIGNLALAAMTLAIAKREQAVGSDLVVQASSGI